MYLNPHMHTYITYAYVYILSIYSWQNYLSIQRSLCVRTHTYIYIYISQPGFDSSFEKLVCLATLKSYDTTKQSVCGWLYIYVCVCVCVRVCIVRNNDKQNKFKRQFWLQSDDLLNQIDILLLLHFCERFVFCFCFSFFFRLSMRR